MGFLSFTRKQIDKAMDSRREKILSILKAPNYDQSVYDNPKGNARNNPFVLEFYSILSTISENNNFLNNIRGLYFEIQKDKDVTGLYDHINNYLVLTLPDLTFDYTTDPLCQETIFHELLHMSSAYLGKNKNAIGFQQYVHMTANTEHYGHSLNEGYTELLTKRYFNRRGNDRVEYYDEEQKIALKIEKIVGREKMIELYFKADLYGVVEELDKRGLDGLDIIHRADLASYFDDKKKIAALHEDLDRVIENEDKRSAVASM